MNEESLQVVVAYDIEKTAEKLSCVIADIIKCRINECSMKERVLIYDALLKNHIEI